MELGKTISTLRTKHGLSQATLSELAGIAAPNISLIENGKTIPKGDDA